MSLMISANTAVSVPGYGSSFENIADLYRVRGSGNEYAGLLEKAGVDTVKELLNRNPADLYKKMTEVNASSRPLVRLLPGLKRVEGWVSHAKDLAPMVTY